MSKTLTVRSPLAHPWWWAALVLLVLNDHFFKGSGLLPTGVTGKLSDFAGLVVAPPLLCALVSARTRAERAIGTHPLLALGLARGAVRHPRGAIGGAAVGLPMGDLAARARCGWPTALEGKAAREHTQLTIDARGELSSRCLGGLDGVDGVYGLFARDVGVAVGGFAGGSTRAGRAGSPRAWLGAVQDVMTFLIGAAADARTRPRVYGPLTLGDGRGGVRRAGR